MPIRNYRPFVLVVLCAIVAALFVVVSPSAQQPAGAAAEITKNLKVITYNVEKKGFGPGFGRNGYPGYAIDKAITLAGNTPGTVAILLQEVCENQKNELLSRYSGKWTMAWRAIGKPGVSTADCGNPINGRPAFVGDMAIWLKGPGETTRQFNLPSGDVDAANYRYGSGLACVFATEFGTSFKVCSTHLPTGTLDSNKSSTTEINAITDPWISAGNAVVVGGDFNIPTPKSDGLNPIYEIGDGSGRFSEADSFAGGRATPARVGRETGRARCKNGDGVRIEDKRDYVFFSKNRVPLNRDRSLSVSETTRAEADYDCIKDGDETPSDPRSDHYLVLAQFNVTVNTD